jgi:hypothetical protein
VLQQSGSATELAVTLGQLTTFLGGCARAEAAATLYGATSKLGTSSGIRAGVIDGLRAALGAIRFDQCAAGGAAMEPAEAVRYARDQIRIARDELSPPDQTLRHSDSPRFNT